MYQNNMYEANVQKEKELRALYNPENLPHRDIEFYYLTKAKPGMTIIGVVISYCDNMRMYDNRRSYDADVKLHWWYHGENGLSGVKPLSSQLLVQSEWAERITRCRLSLKEDGETVLFHVPVYYKESYYGSGLEPEEEKTKNYEWTIPHGEVVTV